jgi:hypothetical protein
MIEIITNDWPTTFWWEVVKWCESTFGPPRWDKNWFFQDDYSLYIHEKYLPFFILRWS